MAHNLKKFQTENDYTAATLNYPAVSWIVSGDTIHFDKTAPVAPMVGDIRVTYNIADTSEEVKLYNGGGGSGSGSESEGGQSESGSGSGFAPTQMWVDGVEETVVGTWRFDTTGLHVVEFKLDGTEIPNAAFYQMGTITKVEIGNNITVIGESSFSYPLILINITVLATTPPALGGAAFDGSSCPIYVPSASVNTYKAASGWNTYASRITAIV